jgi:pimeloyl-ACP methyl ester carboxylesterase
MPRATTSHGVTLYYESVGEGPPMIFHAHHHRAWMYAQVPFFSRYFRVITYDRRGVGRSDSPPGDWTQEDFSRDCLGLMDTLEIETAIIAGASTGGLITMQFGLDYPHRAAALVATNFIWWMPDIIIREHWQPMIDAIDHGTAKNSEGILALMGGRKRSFEWEEDGQSLHGDNYDQTEFYRLAEQSGCRTLGESTAALKSWLAVNSRWDLRPRADEFKELAVPILIMAGNAEPTILIGASWELHRLLPRCEFVLLPGHHVSHLDHALLYNEHIVQFLDRHDLLPSPAG